MNYTYEGFTTGQTVTDGRIVGVVVHPGGGNGTAPGWVAVRVEGFTTKIPASALVALD